LLLGAKISQQLWVGFDAGPSLIVSPHYDDAVLSCWRLLSTKESTVLTVCSEGPDDSMSTDWDLLCGFNHSVEAIAARELENAAALEGWALNHQKSGLKDFAYRDERRFSEQDAQSLQSQVDSWLKQQNAKRVLVAIPVGAGKPRLQAGKASSAEPARLSQPRKTDFGFWSFLKALKHSVFVLFSKRMLQHPDHLDVRDSLLNFLLSENSVSTLLYEELPYLWHERGQAEINKILAENPTFSCKKIIAKVNTADKFSAISKYDSQIVGLDPGLKRLSKNWLIPRSETYWLVSKTK